MIRKKTPIPPADRIPFGQKLAFALGVNMDYTSIGLMVGVLWMPFFNIGLGMSPITLGIILMILRGWDAIIDPIMGNISDNARTRWGRRRPFMLIGAITSACLYPLIWYVPGLVDEAMRPFALTITGMVFFASFTLWSMPYYGLQLELTPNYDERTRLTAWMTLVAKLSALIGGWILAGIILIGMLATGDTSAFEGKSAFWTNILKSVQPLLTSMAGEDALTENTNPIVVGMKIACWAIAAGILVFGLLPALFVKERYYKAETSKQARDPFWKSIRESAGCKPLWGLIATAFFLVLGTASIASLGQYVNFYYACGGNLALGAVIAGWKATVIVIAGILTIPIFTWLGEKFDKKTVVMTMLGCSIFGHILNYFLMTPDNPYLQIIPGVFEACSISAVWLFLPSMKADVADWDEMHTTRRREGSINAFFSWFIKAAHTFSMGIAGFVLQMTGFNARLGEQAPEVVDRMFHVYLWLPLAIWAIAIIAIWLYPLTRKSSEEIRSILEARRGSL